MRYCPAATVIQHPVAVDAERLETTPEHSLTERQHTRKPALSLQALSPAGEEQTSGRCAPGCEFPGSGVSVAGGLTTAEKNFRTGGKVIQEHQPTRGQGPLQVSVRLETSIQIALA